MKRFSLCSLHFGFWLLAFAAWLLPFAASGQISVTNNSPLPTETFTALANSGLSSTTPAGWQFIETGSNANLMYTAGTGSATGGDTYSFGAASSGERALGGLRSANLVPLFGVSYQNNTGAAVTSITISYTGEQWRLGAANRTDRLDFQYAINAASISAGSYTDYDPLDFATPVFSGSVGARDGNVAPFRTDLTSTITGLNVSPGDIVWLRWLDFDASGADDGLAIDDFTITLNSSATPACTEPAQATALNLSSLSSSSISVSFTPATADGYIVIRSTSSSISATPQDVQTYTVGSSLGGGTIISAGATTSLTDNGLAAGTEYFYFIFSYNNTGCTGGPNYNTTSPLAGSQFTQGLSACTTPNAPTGLTLTPANTVISGTFAGSGSSKYLVIRSTSSTLSATPANATVYTPTQSFGGGVVVSYGATTTFTASGLTPATQYYFFVYAANDVCSGEPFYSATALTGSATTTNNSNGIPAGYYNSANGLVCDQLKNALNSIITTGHSQLIYTALDDTQMPITDTIRNDAGTAPIIWDIYSNNVSGPEPFEYGSGQGSPGGFCLGATPSSPGTCWNKEHTFPDSWFGGSGFPDGDLFLVRPADSWLNQQRGNLPYATVGSTNYVYPSTPPYLVKRGSATSGIPAGNMAFEPPAGIKGDIARGYFYIVTRYQANLSGWVSTYSGTAIGSVVDGSTNGGLYPSLQLPYFSMLYQWHINDPVDAREIERNNLVYSQQNNRNPYVDNPAYVERVFSCTGLVPVTIVDFTGTLLKESVQLRWQVTREISFDHFAVERSGDGVHFFKRGEVKGINAENYSYLDGNLPGKVIYYRLKLVDANGSYKYSKVIKVAAGAVSESAQAFPNPAISVISLPVTAQSLYKVSVTDMTGKIVYSSRNNAVNGFVQVNVERLVSGQYVLTVDGTGGSLRSKFIKQ